MTYSTGIMLSNIDNLSKRISGLDDSMVKAIMNVSRDCISPSAFCAWCSVSLVSRSLLIAALIDMV